MNVAKKFAVYALFVVLAVIVSGVYGMAHDQISYAVSSEYFTRFKFRQFDLVDTPLPNRVRAAMVGFLATWWMGVPVGMFVGLAGFIHRGARRMLRVLLGSMLVAVVFTLLFGLCGLLYGYFQTAHIDLADYRGWFIPDGLIDLRRYLCVGYMHNASYLGGSLSIFVAWAFHAVARVKQRSSLE